MPTPPNQHTTTITTPGDPAAATTPPVAGRNPKTTVTPTPAATAPAKNTTVTPSGAPTPPATTITRPHQPQKPKATTATPHSTAGSEDFIPTSSFMYLPLIGADHNRASSYWGDRIMPSPIGDILRSLRIWKDRDYKNPEHDSTIQQLSLKNPGEFAEYRQHAIGIFQKFNTLPKSPNGEPFTQEDILSNPDYMKAYISIYKEAYPRVFEELNLERIAWDRYNYNDLLEKDKKTLGSIIEHVNSHLAYARMYDGISIKNDADGMTFTHNGTAILTISSEHRTESSSGKNSFNSESKTEGNFRRHYSIPNNLTEEQMKMALNHMAEEMSQSRIFSPFGKELNANMHPGQLLYLMKELICVKRIQIKNMNEIREKLAAKISGHKDEKEILQLLAKLDELNAATSVGIGKDVLRKVIGDKRANYYSDLAAQIPKEMHALKLPLTNAASQPTNQPTPPSGNVGLHVGPDDGHPKGPAPAA